MDDKYCPAGKMLCESYCSKGSGVGWCIEADSYTPHFERCPVPSKAKEIKPKVKKYQVLYQTRDGRYCLSPDKHVSLSMFTVLHGNNPTPIRFIEETMIEE